jgi:hypothetical protein
MMLPPAIAEGLAQLTREAREAGYREGYAAGREQERGEWVRRVAALLPAGDDVENTTVETGATAPRPPREGRGECAPIAAPDGTRADGPAPVAEAVTPSQAGGVVSPPELPAAPPPVAPVVAAPVLAGAGRGGRQRVGYRTAGRLALLRTEYPAGTYAHVLLPMLNALPGPPVPDSTALANWMREAGVRRPDGWDRSAAARAAVAAKNQVRGVTAARKRIDAAPPPPAPVPVGEAPALEAGGADWQTVDRRAALERLYQDGIPLPEIRELLAGMIGPAMPAGGVAKWAETLGLQRPKLPAAEPEPMASVERIARTCLRCSKSFAANGRFERLCGYCRSVGEGIAA